MTASLRLLIGVMLGALLPALTTARSVTYDYSKPQDLSRLRTYSFKDVHKTDNPFVDERIAAAVAAQLGARGLTRDDRDPDVWVVVRQMLHGRSQGRCQRSPVMARHQREDSSSDRQAVERRETDQSPGLEDVREVSPDPEASS